ncbi:unnamed protein product [Pleuronectes platessa]|uniref:Uncharacterized protein n=1 Tax=Pleuronectes platessa TaxID=8262 RepID=A0A9N7YXR9_PLEPL|nr:unnamed protein product [Pleuronectes platessa]
MWHTWGYHYLRGLQTGLWALIHRFYLHKDSVFYSVPIGKSIGDAKTFASFTPESCGLRLLGKLGRGLKLVDGGHNSLGRNGNSSGPRCACILVAGQLSCNWCKNDSRRLLGGGLDPSCTRAAHCEAGGAPADFTHLTAGHVSPAQVPHVCRQVEPHPGSIGLAGCLDWSASVSFRSLLVKHCQAEFKKNFEREDISRKGGSCLEPVRDVRVIDRLREEKNNAKPS